MTPWNSFRNFCRTASDVLLAAPYIKVDALRLVLDNLPPDAHIECVTRWTPLDIQMGASDVVCRDIITSKGGSFRLHNSLHAKYFRFDGYALVGSANLTAAGLGYAGKGNTEILCEPASSFDRDAFERELMSGSREVSDEEYEIWRQIPVRPLLPAEQVPIGMNTHIQSAGLVDWIPQTRNPEYLWQFYTKRASEIVMKEQRPLAQADIHTMQVPSGLMQEGFVAWVRTALTAAPFIDTVRQATGLDDQDAWDLIVQRWDISLSEAARALDTSNNWLYYFFEQNAD